MKVKLNVTTNYEGCTFKLGNEIDIPLNVAQRWINKGIAHVVKEEVKPIEPDILKRITDEAGRWNTKAIEDELKKLEEKSKPEIKTDEIIFREPEVTEVDLIEPIPERFTSFEDELKISKPTWKPKTSKLKKKNK